MLTRQDAREILTRSKIRLDVDFHALSSSEVESLLVEANRVKYRAPKVRNGSRARYFHAFLMRRARDRAFRGFI